MDLVSLSFSVCIMMVYLPGPALLSNTDNRCPCSEIPPWTLTKPPTETCNNTENRFRYKCIDGYLRKAGTSDLIKCLTDGGALIWSTPRLECIPDPKRTTTTTQQARTSTTTAASTTQMMQNVSSAPEKGNITETSTHETSTQTAGKTATIRSSTPSPRVANSSSSPLSSPTESLTTTTVATVSTLILVIGCSSAIVLLLYRRNFKKRVPVPTEDEQETGTCMSQSGQMDEQML